MPYAAVAVVYSMICDFAFLKQSQQRTEDDCCLVVSSVNMILSFVDNIMIKKDLCKTSLQVFLTIHLPMYDKLLKTFTETEKDLLKHESALIHGLFDNENSQGYPGVAKTGSSTAFNLFRLNDMAKIVHEINHLSSTDFTTILSSFSPERGHRFFHQQNKLERNQSLLPQLSCFGNGQE